MDEKLKEEMEKPTNIAEENDLKENKLWALLCYLGVLVVIPLLVKKDSAFCQFHAKQGLVLLAGGFLSFFPIFGWIIGIAVFVLSVLGIVSVIEGRKKKLPVIGELAEKIKF